MKMAKRLPGETLRQPILRSVTTPIKQKYGEPVEVQEYARVFSNSLTPAVQTYTMVVSPIPNTYTDEAGQARGSTIPWRWWTKTACPLMPTQPTTLR